MEELLVAFACYNGTGCRETSNQYFNTHPEAVQMISNGEKQVIQYIGPEIIKQAGPVFYIATVVNSGTAIIKLNKDFTLQMTQKNVIIGFNRSL